MNIEKTQQTGGRQQLFSIVSPMHSLLTCLLIAIILISEAIYMFLLHTQPGLGPASAITMILLAAILYRMRHDVAAWRSTLKKEGQAVPQRIAITESGLTISTGSISSAHYAWDAFVKLRVRRKHLVFRLPTSAIYIDASCFDPAELDQIVSFWTSWGLSDQQAQPRAQEAP